MLSRALRRLLRRSSLVVVCALAALAALGGPAFGAAEIQHITLTTPVPNPPDDPGPILVDDTCAGAGVVGVLTGTDTVDGQLVTTPTGGGSFSGTDTLVFRIDFPDGSYLLGSQRVPLSATSNDHVLTFGSTLH